MADYARPRHGRWRSAEGPRYSLQLAREAWAIWFAICFPVELSTATLRTLATIALKKAHSSNPTGELRGSGATTTIQGTDGAAETSSNGRRQSEGRSYWVPAQRKNSIAPSLSKTKLQEACRQLWLSISLTCHRP